MRNIFIHKYDDIISIQNLLLAWEEFVSGKKNKKDVAEFSLNLSKNTLSLHTDLKTKTYKHGPYQSFTVNDPKRRDINKASVRDRLLHHAIYRVLYPCFDKQFIHDSYSSRKFKGTHRAIKRFKQFYNKVSKNNTKTVWILSCDIRKFFANIDHQILLQIISKDIEDKNIIRLLKEIIKSFNSGKDGVGLSLGNLTSQLFVNIYMNKFDRFVKHQLKAIYYIRYADDFVFMSIDRNYLKELLPKIEDFLQKELKLKLHPNKVSIKTVASGVDFLGWVHFPKHRVLRTVTKRRMFRKIKESEYNEKIVQSYLGMISHGNSYKVSGLIKKEHVNKNS